jgi:hypothetical protein
MADATIRLSVLRLLQNDRTHEKSLLNLEKRLVLLSMATVTTFASFQLEMTWELHTKVVHYCMPIDSADYGLCESVRTFRAFAYHVSTSGA